MILRRVIDHFRKQEWTAIFLDFVIVVVGVFIGIQVANWNDARRERSLDRSYMLRLHDEVQAAEQPMAEIAREQETIARFLSQAIARITGAPSAESLSRDECDAIFASHIYRPLLLTLPTLDELLSSGRASILRDNDLRGALARLSQREAATRNTASYVASGAYVLPHLYPEMVRVNPEMTADRFGFAPFGGHECAIALMTGSKAFRNDLIDNRYRMDAYIREGLGPERLQLMEVHRLLDRTLNIQHGKEAAP